MIEKIKGLNIKGLKFEQELSEKTIVFGANGSGKSARTIALTLLILGYIPGATKKGATKKNADIFDEIAGDDKQMWVGATIDGTEFSRGFVKSPKGTVSQKYAVAGKNAKKDIFVGELAKSGCPKLFDLSTFMNISDGKKIEYIFDLFPPAGDLSELSTNIEDLKDKTKTNRRDKIAKEAVLTELAKTRNDIKLPAGTVVETGAEIDDVNNELIEARKDLQEAETKIKEAKDKENAEQQEADRLAEEKEQEEARDKKAAEDKKKLDDALAKSQSDKEARLKAEATLQAERDAAEKSLAARNKRMGIIPLPKPADSINRIMAVCDRTGASAAVIQCKKELKLFQEKEVA